MGNGSSGLDRVRLIKLLGLLGSEHAGERDTAARLACELVRGAGSTWADILAPVDSIAEQACRALLAENEELRAEIERLRSQPRLLPFAEPEDFDEALALVLAWRHRLTEWEQRFLTSINNRRRLSDKQRLIVWEIVDKIGRWITVGVG